MDEIREEAIVQEEFDFMTEVDRNEMPGRLGGKPRPDQITLSFVVRAGTGEDAISRVISFAQEDGWEPDPTSATGSDSQRKALPDGRSMRLIFFAVDDRLIVEVEAPV